MHCCSPAEGPAARVSACGVGGLARVKAVPAACNLYACFCGRCAPRSARCEHAPYARRTCLFSDMTLNNPQHRLSMP